MLETRIHRLLIIMFASLSLFAVSCQECTEDRKTTGEFLGPDYWPLYGRWSLENVGMDAHQNADGPESGTMHEITWEADGTFVVEWANDVIQVGHVRTVNSVNTLGENHFHITVFLDNDCPKKNPWFCGEYTITASSDITNGQGSMLMTGFSFPWGDTDRRKALSYVKL